MVIYYYILLMMIYGKSILEHTLGIRRIFWKKEFGLVSPY